MNLYPNDVNKKIQLAVLILLTLLLGRVKGYGVISCPTAIVTASTTYAANYGCMVSNDFWIGGYVGKKLYQFSTDGVLLNEYDGGLAGQNFGQIVQLDYDIDNGFLWLGDGNSYSFLSKFNPVTGLKIKTITMDPTHTGTGGIQGVVYDKVNKKIFLGLAQAGGGTDSGLILKFNPVTEAIEMTVTAQTNVNGMTLAYSGGKTYILAACTGFWSKTDTYSGISTKYDTLAYSSGTGYRVATDNTYVYVADYNDGTILKFRLDTGAYINTWSSGSLLNTILYDGIYIWVSGDDGNINIHDKNTGAIICTLAGLGQSDLVFDGFSVWSVKASTGEVLKISDRRIPLTLSPTPTVTQTPYYTRTHTPTITNTVTLTSTNTNTPSPTQSVTQSATPTYTIIVSKTFTPTVTETHTISPTFTPTSTFTETWTASETHTLTPTNTITPTSTAIPTLVIVYYASTDTNNHKTDITIGWDVMGISYIVTAGNWSRILHNSDNVSLFPDTFRTTLKNLVYEASIPVRVTVQAADGTMIPSNVIYVSPKASPTP